MSIWLLHYSNTLSETASHNTAGIWINSNTKEGQKSLQQLERHFHKDWNRCFLVGQKQSGTTVQDADKQISTSPDTTQSYTHCLSLHHITLGKCTLFMCVWQTFFTCCSCSWQFFISNVPTLTSDSGPSQRVFSSLQLNTPTSDAESPGTCCWANTHGIWRGMFCQYQPKEIFLRTGSTIKSSHKYVFTHIKGGIYADSQGWQIMTQQATETPNTALCINTATNTDCSQLLFMTRNS